MSIYDKSSLVLIPSGTKTGKVFSQKPVSGDGDFTFTRSSAATRVNADGNIEKETQNLITYSNDFSNSHWAKYLLSLTSGQSGYDGTNNAWLIEKSGAYGNVYRNLSNSGVFTWSVYAKAGSFDFLALRYRNTSNQYRSAFFNLSNGTLGGADSNLIAHSIEDVGGGWYRCFMVLNDPAINQVMIYPSDVNNGIGNTGTGSIYIQDAQLEQGLVARDYIETTTSAVYGGITDNTPRLDYTDSSCPALLLEPQRTNYLPHSEWIGGWSPVNDATIDSVQSFTLGSTGARFQAGAIGSPSGDFVFYAVFDSADIGKTIKLSYYDATASTWVFGNDITIDSNGRAERLISTGSNVIGNVAFYGTSTSQSFTLKYCQLEAGSYATSYIPTYGSSVTRNADSTDDLDTSSLLTQSNNNTFFGEVVNHKNTGNTRFIASYDSARDNGDRILIYTSNGSSNYTLHCQYKVSGETSVQFNIKTGVNYGDTIKFAVVFNGTQMIGFANGAKTATATIVDAENFNKFDISDVANEVGIYKQLLAFPTALTDQELIDLTTL